MRICLVALKYYITVSSRNISSEIKTCKKTSTLHGPPWKILFFGTDSFALHSLQALCAKFRTGTLIESLGIVTKAGSIVEKFGKSEGLTSFAWPLNAVEIKHKYDIGMVVSFGNLIPKDIIQSFPLGCINVHASILPRWRGAAPIIHAVMHGDMETGITIMRIQPQKFDIGEIVRQYRIPIGNSETAKQLEDRLAVCGSYLLMECLRDLPRCVEMATPQPTLGINYAPKIRSEMAKINWYRMPARVVFNLHRALGHVYPVTTRWHGAVVKFTELSLDEDSVRKKVIESSEMVESTDRYRTALEFLNTSNEVTPNRINENFKPILTSTKDELPGTVHFSKKNKVLMIKCVDGNHVVVGKLKLVGKSMSAVDFYNGFLKKLSQKDWIFET